MGMFREKKMLLEWEIPETHRLWMFHTTLFNFIDCLEPWILMLIKSFAKKYIISSVLQRILSTHQIQILPYQS